MLETRGTLKTSIEKYRCAIEQGSVEDRAAANFNRREYPGTADLNSTAKHVWPEMDVSPKVRTIEGEVACELCPKKHNLPVNMASFKGGAPSKRSWGTIKHGAEQCVLQDLYAGKVCVCEGRGLGL